MQQFKIGDKVILSKGSGLMWSDFSGTKKAYEDKTIFTIDQIDSSGAPRLKEVTWFVGTNDIISLRNKPIIVIREKKLTV